MRGDGDDAVLSCGYGKWDIHSQLTRGCICIGCELVAKSVPPCMELLRSSRSLSPKFLFLRAA